MANLHRPTRHNWTVKLCCVGQCELAIMLLHAIVHVSSLKTVRTCEIIGDKCCNKINYKISQYLLNAVLKLYYSTGASLNMCNDSVMRFRSFSRKRNINTLVTVTVTNSFCFRVISIIFYCCSHAARRVASQRLLRQTCVTHALAKIITICPLIFLQSVLRSRC